MLFGVGCLVLVYGLTWRSGKRRVRRVTRGDLLLALPVALLPLLWVGREHGWELAAVLFVPQCYVWVVAYAVAYK